RGKYAFNKRLVGARGLPRADAVAAIGGIRKERVADELHVRPNLMGAAGFEAALQQRHGAVALEHAVMRDGVLALVALGVHGLHLAVAQAAADVAAHGAYVVELAPGQGQVAALDGVVKKLLREVRHGRLGLADNEQARRVLVDAVHQAGANFTIAAGG
nr:hypothetical protein [Tanacetum cinerariifolium]